MTDEDIRARRERLSSLFAAHHDDVYRFALARCGSRPIAEEVTSDAFTDAARLCADGRGDQVTAAWLVEVARRRLIDRWRRAGRERRRVEKLARQRVVPYDRSDRTGNDERVLHALESLPERQRAALTLRYLDEHSVAEVATMLDTTYRAAESLLARARGSFMTAYEELA